MTESFIVTQDQIVNELRELGLEKKDYVLMHSSLTSIGWVEGGADAVLDALLDVIGPQGALMVPTFSFLNFQPIFDPQVTPSEVGLISETARRRPYAVRSLHPRHSVAVIGSDAEQLTAGHLEVGALGRDSPPDKLAKKGGYVLLLGVGCEANSVIHIAEAYAQVPCLEVRRSPGFPEEAVVRMPTGEKVIVSLIPIPTCSRGFGKLEPVLKERALIRYGKVGNAHCQLVKAQDVIETAVELLQSDPRALLCDLPDCWACDRKREKIEAAQKRR